MTLRHPRLTSDPQVRIQLKDHIDRCRKHKRGEHVPEETPHDDEDDDTHDTLRRNEPRPDETPRAPSGPSHPAQRPLPVPPSRVVVVPDLAPPSKPLPPIPVERSPPRARASGLFKVAHAQKPEDLDVLARELNELGGQEAGRAARRRQQENVAPPPPPALSDSSDSSADETEECVARNDGTLLASDPPRPLPVDPVLPPSRPLPPPPVESHSSKPLPPIPDSDQTLVLRPRVRKPEALPDLLSETPTAEDQSVANLLQQYRQANQKQRSFLTFGFSGSPSPRRESHVTVNVSPAAVQDTPEIRKYKKRFSSEVLCAALWGVNLLIGTENGLMLLDRSGQGKVYQLISRRRFQQMEVLEGQNILVTISGRKARVRVYYLSWLKSKVIRTDSVSARAS